MIGMLITMTLPYFWSCTAPPPPAPSKTKSQEGSAEDGLLRESTSSNGVIEKLCSVDHIPYSDEEVKVCFSNDATHSVQEREEIPQDTMHHSNLGEIL